MKNLNLERANRVETPDLAGLLRPNALTQLAPTISPLTQAMLIVKSLT